MGTTASSPARNSSSSNAFEPVGIGSSHADDDDDNGDLCCLVAPRTTGKPPSRPSRSSPPVAPPSTSSSRRRECGLREPKKLLWGCSDAEEHYARIADACERVKHLHGEAGLRELDLEYRMVHNPLSCRCHVDHVGFDDGIRAIPDELDPSRWGSADDEDDELSSSDAGSHRAEEYMVPIDTPLLDSPDKRAMREHDGEEERREEKTRSNGAGGRSLAESPSGASLFSLATHRTWSTGEDRDLPDEAERECALRLAHVPPLDGPPTLVEAGNYEGFAANGVMYDEVSRLCTEYAQATMMEEGDLRWVPICDERGIRALASNDRTPGGRRRKVLLVVTGKGKVRAGMFSRRHVITTGIEAGTALPMIREARKRDMDVIVLDPNANGDANGMSTVDASLRHFFGADDGGDNDEVYVVAHSMAGAQMVRYLHGDKQAGEESPDAPGGREDELALLRRIRAVAFTDSNHNINWTKETNPELTDMLVGPSSLYIKAHKIHQDEPKELGAPHHDCTFWRHRFGDIRTIWAGTHEHALTNYIPRHYIWQHFDSFSERNTNSDTNVDGSVSNDEEERVLMF